MTVNAGTGSLIIQTLLSIVPIAFLTAVLIIISKIVRWIRDIKAQNRDLIHRVEALEKKLK